jgi:recombination protein RecT
MTLLDQQKPINSIQEAAAKTAVKPATRTPANIMRETLSLASTQQLMQEVLHDNRESFVASLIDLYSSDTYLQKCAPGAVMKEALKAVSLKLPINKALGFAWIIPYNDNKSGQTLPQFQLGYKGYIQLAQRTGAYKTMNMDNVYEGELRVVNRLTGEIDLGGDRISDKVIGYFAYIETVNGFSKTLYWSVDKVISHAKKFSKSYNSGAAIWKQNFDEMAQKTVMRNLISKWGVMSVDLQRAIDLDNADLADKAITGEGTVDGDTGEIITEEAVTIE